MQTLFLLSTSLLLACLSDAFLQRSPLSSGLSISHHESTRSSASLPLHMFDFLKPKEEEDKSDEPPPAAAAAEVEEPQDFSDDPVDKIFSFFFGAKEESPMGMKRFGRERFPEQYPAVLDEWAAPVEGDDKEMAALRPMLKNTNLEFRNLKLTYSANRDGWNAKKFHDKVDKLGGGLVVCTTTDGLICGGYNPKGWVGYGEARGSIAAFLFVFKRGLTELPSKLRKVGGPSLAQQDLPEIGPSFGADSLVIPFEQSRPKIARSKLGSYYERFPDGTNTLFGKRGASVELKDLKVYHGVYAEGEYIPFTDAEPFALY
ncbi:unnamed protein product [Cylindrotheca closterium]|uniref:TLDc domain-containing protein n=1 Tax=Cylindrotheca closterium TaxID=2856 RepID=A0AAD2CUW9_9STRA|nr:unnamed protein product [Cylindrotheca closterium]